MRDYPLIPLWGGRESYVRACSECGAVVPFEESTREVHDAWHATMRPDLDTTPEPGYTEGNNETTEV